LPQLNRHDFLGVRERCLQPMRRIRAILEAILLFPFPDSVFVDGIAYRQYRDSFVALRNLTTDRRRGGGVFVQGDHHD
jgi:hypothetical protein